MRYAVATPRPAQRSVTEPVLKGRSERAVTRHKENKSNVYATNGDSEATRGEPTPSTPSDDDRTVGEDHSDEIMKRNGVPSPQIDADRRGRCGRSSKRHTRRRDAEETLSTMKPNRGGGGDNDRHVETRYNGAARRTEEGERRVRSAAAIYKKR